MSMNTIEQAAKRLEQLRRAGIQVDELPAPPEQVATPAAAQPAPIASAPPPAPVPSASPHVTAEAAVAAPSPALMASAASISAHPANQAPEPEQESEQASLKRSRTVNLDFNRMQQAGLLVPGMPRSQLEDEVRIIKRPLLDNTTCDESIRPPRANLIMLTSALPNEGKTQTAINLAISIAMELDHTVLLVEADVIRPSVLERLGVKAHKGLLDILEHPGTDLSDVLLRTNIPKLTLLPAGTASGRSTELLASVAMDSLLEELASKYADRVIIFDTPPVLSTTESRVLATHMGQVVMVVEAEKTLTSTVKQAFETVEQHPLVLAMLNKCQGLKAGRAYGYYAP